jgi:TolA-binding protein
MAQGDSVPATKQDVREIVTAVLAKAGLATKKDVHQVVEQGNSLVLAAVEKMVEDQNKQIDQRFDKVESDVADVRRQLTDLKADTSTRKETDELKRRLERLEGFHSH